MLLMQWILYEIGTVNMNLCLMEHDAMVASRTGRIDWSASRLDSPEQGKGFLIPLDHKLIGPKAVLGESFARAGSGLLCHVSADPTIALCIRIMAVLSLWSSGQSSWPQTLRSRVQFPALPHFLSSSGSGTGSTQPCGDK
jgi:hypothetical protein